MVCPGVAADGLRLRGDHGRLEEGPLDSRAAGLPSRSPHDNSRLAGGRRLLRASRRTGLDGRPPDPQDGRRLFPGRPESRLARRRRLDLRLEHRLGAPRRSRRHRARPAAWRSRTTSCTRGACSSSAGCSCRSTCGRACSRCRSSSSAASRRLRAGPLDHLAGRLRADQDRRRHLRRRRRVRRTACRS